MYDRFLIRPLLVSLIVLAVAGCGGDDDDNVAGAEIPVTVTTDVAAVTSGNQVSVGAVVDGADDSFTYAWSSDGGRFSDSSAATTIWTAPEAIGSFTLTCVVSDSRDVGIGSADVTVTLYVATDTPYYRGAEICSGCHAQAGQPGANQYDPWSESPHAEAMQALVDIGQDQNGYCVGCHSVGTKGLFADPDLDNGGYDDTAVARLENVQCENCHGPASNHPNPDFRSVAVSLEAELCGSCHNGPHHPTFEEWQTSSHAVPVEFAAGRAECAKCHNGLEGPRYLDDPEGYVQLPNAPAEIVAHTCATCHDPHGSGNPGELRDASVTDVVLPNAILQPRGGAGRLCMSCHNGRRTAEDVESQVENGTSRFGPHHSVQGDMISGVNAYEDVAPGFPFSSSLHINVRDACVTCHTSPNDGDPENGIPAFTGHTFWPTVGACETCHGVIETFDDIIAKGDFDGDGLIEGVQSEIVGLLDVLEQTVIDVTATPEGRAALETDFVTNVGNPAYTTRDQRAAAYNWAFVAFDGSSGVHNTTYSVQLLQQSILSLDSAGLRYADILVDGVY